MKEKISTQSMDIPDNKISILREYFPECFTEGKIDFDKLKTSVGKSVDFDDERYSITWAGRNNTFKCIHNPSISTLVPDKRESVNFDDTKNIFIEGENLEVLKLLQKPYFGKIKCIYIDPPYNTGNDFIYKDNFRQGTESYLEQTGQSKDGVRLTTNPDTSGRFHSDWISFMYSRLYLARDLLSEDGLIFVSIDDSEAHNLRLIMNEIFGERNLISEVVWNSKYTTSNDKKFISTQHEYVIIYAKNINEASFNLLPRTEKADSAYKNPDNDHRGRWKSTPLHAKSGRKNMKYKFTNIRKFNGEKISPFVWSAPKGRYPRYNRETLERLEADNRITCGKDGTGVPNAKTFLKEVQQGMVTGSLWKYEDVGHTHEANEELAALIGKGVFDNPKPAKLIKQILRLSTNSKSSDTVLDFFAGSGTTAHAVMELNREDAGNRRFICVQIPERIENSNLPTISDICKKRMRCAIKQIAKDSKETDIGFKVFKFAKSNYKIWEDYSGNDIEKLKKQIKLFENPLVKGYKDINVIYECMLKEGLDLNNSIEKVSTDLNTIYRITGKRKFCICLDKSIKQQSVDSMDLSSEDTFVCIDAALDDSQKKNISMICKLKTM